MGGLSRESRKNHLMSEVGLRKNSIVCIKHTVYMLPNLSAVISVIHERTAGVNSWMSTAIKVLDVPFEKLKSYVGLRSMQIG